MKCSDATNEISAALAKAQGAINNPGKKALNPHFKSQYADLSSGINAIRDGLSANAIAVIQSSRMDADVMMLDTRLTHASGQWFECEWPVCKFPAAPQQIGSALTYARRYSLFSMVGIAGEDDDGNAANGALTPAPAALRDDDQAAYLLEMARARARAGTEAYQHFWIGLTNEERKQLTGHHARLKAIASNSDAVPPPSASDTGGRGDEVPLSSVSAPPFSEGK